MAYYDENGKITIDEAAAEKDIKRMSESIELLNNSLDALRSVNRQAEEFQGAMSTAIIDKSTELMRKQEKLISQLDEAISFIRKTVKHYEEVDRALKEAIEAAKISDWMRDTKIVANAASILDNYVNNK